MRSGSTARGLGRIAELLEVLDESIALVALNLEAVVQHRSARAERALELLEQGGQVVGAIGAWREAGDDGDEFAAAFLAADADGLVFGVEDLAIAAAWTSARGVRLAAALACDGAFEGSTGKEACHGRRVATRKRDGAGGGWWYIGRMTATRDHFHEAERNDTRLRCPKDGTLMQKEQVGGDAGVALDRCGHCGALWLDKGELEKLLVMKAAKRADIGPFKNDRYVKPLGALTCPRDNSVLTEIADGKQKHVLVMLCSDCGGKLLDAGELLDLQEFTFAERLKATLGM